MHEIKAIIRSDRLEALVHALRQIPDLPGVTVSAVTGYGRIEPLNAQGGADFGQVAMTKLEVVVPQDLLETTLSCIRNVARTGRAGDGKVFVLPVERALKIQSDEQGVDAL